MKFYVLGIRWYLALLLVVILGIGCTIFPDDQGTVGTIIAVAWVGLIIKRCVSDD